MPGSSIPPEELEQLTADIVAALKTVYDPEIPADIYELGLIYKIDVDDERNIAVEMTLTSPGCPVAGEMPTWVENAVASVPGVGQVTREAHLRPALGQGPHVRRGQAGARDVLSRSASRETIACTFIAAELGPLVGGSAAFGLRRATGSVQRGACDLCRVALRRALRISLLPLRSAEHGRQARLEGDCP